MRLAAKLRWLAVVPAALFLTGCSDATAGSPTASDGPATSSTTSSKPSSSSPTTPKAEPDFSNTALCDLLTPDEAINLGGSGTGEPGNSLQDGHPICTWSDDTSLILGFQKGGEFAAPTGPEITNTDITIAGQPAVLSKRVTDVRTNCQVLMKVGKEGMVSALAGLHDGGIGKYEECELATEFANIVIPKVLEYYR